MTAAVDVYREKGWTWEAGQEALLLFQGEK